MDEADEVNIQSIKTWQILLNDIHPVVEKELIRLALVYFTDAKKCRIEIQLPTSVKVYLTQYSGLRGLYYKYIKNMNKLHSENAKKLVKSILFWLPPNKNGIKPKIEVFVE